MIVTLLGRRASSVGVSATSHKVIGNLLREVLAAAAKARRRGPDRSRSQATTA